MNLPTSIFACFFLALLLIGPSASTILFQGFNWESWKKPGGFYNSLMGQVDAIADAGVTHVWLPPSSQTADSEGYLPGKLYDLDSSNYGNKAQLQALIGALHQRGLKAVADVVINHRSAAQKDNQGIWCIFEGGASDSRLNWGPNYICKNDTECTDSTGNIDSGDTYVGAPDVDHLNPQAQGELSDWMNWLKSDIGFDGFRFDFARGYASSVMKIYMQNTSPDFAVGELWYEMLNGSDGKPNYNQDDHRYTLLNWTQGAGGGITAFDFTTKGILQVAVQDEWWRMADPQKRPAGLLGIAPGNAVTFIDNHDTGSTQQKWPFPSDKVMLGYAYILTHPGYPSIFYDHFFDWGLGNEISNLVAVRKRNSVTETSPVDIMAADTDLYVAMIGGQIIVKIGTRYSVGNLIPAGFNITVSGNNYCVWEKVSMQASRKELGLQN